MAKITATPNPVYLPIGQTAGNTKIDWATESDSRARVHVSVNGGAEQLFDGDKDRGNRQGSKNRSIALGEAHLFRLREANAANTLLASVSVTAEPTVAVQIDMLGDAALTLATYGTQAIHSTIVWPGLHDVEMSFHTTLATVPIVEIYRDASESTAALVTAVFPIFAGNRTHHVLKFGDPPRLAPGTQFFFKIVAGTPAPLKGMPAVQRGSFTTGRQDVRVVFDRIFMVRDGDPSSAGDMSFTFGVGDADTKERLFPMPAPSHREDLDDGATAFVNKQFNLSNAPRRLWVEVRGEDDDRSAIPLPGSGLNLVGTLPSGQGPMTGSWENEFAEGAWVWTELDTLDGGVLTAGFRELPFSMATGNFGVAFHVHGRLQVTGFPQPAVRIHDMVVLKKYGSAVLGKAIAVGGGSGGKAKMATLAPDGAVYVKSIGEAAADMPRHSWTTLGGRFADWLTAVALDDRHLDLFALDADGSVHHKRHAEGRRPDGAWRRLGGAGAFIGPLAAEPGKDGRIDLVGTDRDGNLHHTTIEPGARHAGWQPVGGGVAGGPVAIQVPGAGLGLFALGRDGTVLHKRRHGGRWQPGAKRWDVVGDGLRGGLAVRPLDGGGVLLVVLTEGRMLHRLEWKNYPEGAPARRWRAVGSLDELLQSRLIADASRPADRSPAAARQARSPASPRPAAGKRRQRPARTRK